MRILLVSQNFYPENFKSNDIAFEIKKKGHDVTVLTGIPHYPQGSYPSGYGLFQKRIEVIDGVKVYRCFQVPRGKRFTKLLLPLTYLSFMFFGSIWALYLGIFKKYDAILVHQVSPITQTLPAIVIKKIQKIPLVLWVLDLWPEAFTSGSGIKNKLVLSLLSKYVNFSYKNSDKILISSRGFKESIIERGTNQKKIEYFPNWAEDIFQDAKEFEIQSLPSGFKIMLAGNLGVSQNLENVMSVAKELRKEELRWIFLGDGSKKQWLETFIQENQLENSVFLMGKHPIETMPSYYKEADMMLLSLGNQYEDLKMVVPARLQSYMAAGKPVLGFVDGAAVEIIEESNCGYAIKADDIEGMVNLIKNKILPEKEQLPTLGANGKTYFITHFSKEKCLDHLEEIINKLY